MSIQEVLATNFPKLHIQLRVGPNLPVEVCRHEFFKTIESPDSDAFDKIVSPLKKQYDEQVKELEEAELDYARAQEEARASLAALTQLRLEFDELGETVETAFHQELTSDAVMDEFFNKFPEFQAMLSDFIVDLDDERQGQAAELEVIQAQLNAKTAELQSNKADMEKLNNLLKRIGGSEENGKGKRTKLE